MIVTYRLRKRQPGRTRFHRRQLGAWTPPIGVRNDRITALAEQVFGEPVRAWRWLRKPKAPFDGKTPVEMLATEAAARLVEEMIVQIDHGMFA